MKFKSVVLGLMFGAFATVSANADILIQNLTSSEISGIYISDASSDDWEENLIEGYVLPPGNEITITVNGQYDKFDMRVESTEGGSEDYLGFPGSVYQISLQGAGKSEIKYNN